MSYIIYIFIFCASAHLLKISLEKNKIDAFSGFLFGGIFFFIIPALLTIILGPIEAEGLNLNLFTGARFDISLFALSIFLPLLSFLFLSLNLSSSYATYPKLSRFNLTIGLSIITLLIVFKISGKSEGKHWADASSTNGIIPNIVAVLYLTLRIYIFSLASILITKNKRIALYIFIFTVLDVILTGNRISLLYFSLSIYLSQAFTKKILFTYGIILLPPVILFSAIYPAIRGVLWSSFGGLQGLNSAAIYAFENFNLGKAGASVIWNLFEAANLSIFQYIFDHFGHDIKYINGQTVLLKPITLLIPRGLWGYKPEGLGIRLGDMIAGIPGLSLNSLMLGEFWANFGWASFFFLFTILLFLLIAIYSNKFAARDIDLSRFIFFIAFSSWRHEFSYFVFSLITGVIVIKLLSLTENLIKKKITL